MCKEKKPIYDPLHAHVTGVDEEQAELLRREYLTAGDPMPKPEPPKEEIIFKLPGIRLVRTTRAK